MAISRKIFGELAEVILEGGAIQAVKFFSEKLRVKATRRVFKGKIDNRSKDVEILFTIGPPNYEEWEFLKKPDRRWRTMTNGLQIPKGLQIKWSKEK